MGSSLSRRSAWLLTILAASAYAALIWIVPPGYHRPAAVLSLAVAALAGWFLGPREGVAAAVVVALLEVMISGGRALGGPQELFLEGLPVYALALGAGVGAGSLRQRFEEMRRRERTSVAGEAAVFEALRQRDEFLAAASHDLQTPVSSIRLSTRRLGRDVRAGKAIALDELIRELDYLETAAMRVQDVVSDLLDVARLQVGQTLELDRHPVDLVLVARRVAEDHTRGLEPHHGGSITVESRENEGSTFEVRLPLD